MVVLFIGLISSNILVFFIVEDRVFKIDTYWITRKFYAAANAIYCHTKNVQELTRLHLFDAFILCQF